MRMILQLAAALALSTLFGVLNSAHGQIVNQPPVPDWIQPNGATSAAAEAESDSHFARTFVAPSHLLKAILLAAGNGSMRVRFNGTLAGEISGRDRAQSLDVTSLVRAGTNTLVVSVRAARSTARLSALLELNGDLARLQWVPSDHTWRASMAPLPFGEPPDLSAPGWVPVRTLGRVDANPDVNPFDPKRAIDAYNSWKLALSTNAATAAGTFTRLPGFRAELIHSARADEGSWVAMAFDPQGRLTLAREKRGLLRVTLAGQDVQRVEVIDDTLLECRGLLYAHGSLYANANNSKALVRLRDTNGDGVFETAAELLRTEGGVGHGRNHIKLGPDGFIYLAHGNNVKLPARLAPSSPLRNLAEDQLIPCPWDPAMFDGDVLVPAGHVLRLDPDAREVQLFAGGFRNPLDVAFNADGEMFTFDADMEWDVGAPWYMPNRVLHVASGADLGFRRGTGRFPAWYADTWPSVADIGLASPTAVIFGTGAKFPERYQRALFICDWAYGRILAVHLREAGASYLGESELFIAGRPLNVTDACIGPDGAMWFTTGGRGTQSGLYRVSYDGAAEPIATRPQADRAGRQEASTLRDLRRRLEGLHGDLDANRAQVRLAEAWPHLGHPDRWIRNAARIALETVPASLWRDRALAEPDGPRALAAWLALARVGSAADAVALSTRMLRTEATALDPAQQLDWSRTVAVAFTRLGPPDSARRTEFLNKLEPMYPATETRLNYELCELLVFLDSPQIIPKTVSLIVSATHSEDLLHYLFFLRTVREGWSLDTRRACFEALHRAERMLGARQYFKALQDIRKEMADALSPSDRAKLAMIIDRKITPPVTPGTRAAFVKDWKMSDLVESLATRMDKRSRDSGRAALVTAQCTACHRVSLDPAVPSSTIGPDLTAVASRFSRRDLLEQILDPSKVIDEKFRQTTFELAGGAEITGVIEREAEQEIVVQTNPLPPATMVVRKADVRGRRVSAVSPMPSGLLNGLSEEQILDLLAFLENATAAAK